MCESCKANKVWFEGNDKHKKISSKQSWTVNNINVKLNATFGTLSGSYFKTGLNFLRTLQYFPPAPSYVKCLLDLYCPLRVTPVVDLFLDASYLFTLYVGASVTQNALQIFLILKDMRKAKLEFVFLTNINFHFCYAIFILI